MMPILQDLTRDVASDGRPHGMIALTQTDAMEYRPDVIERLEALDDVVFAAIDGDPQARDAAAATWYSALRDLGRKTVEESRRQYLRRAQSVLNTMRGEINRSPAELCAAMEIIVLLGQLSRQDRCTVEFER